LSDAPGRTYDFGPFHVDAARRLLEREGRPVRLTAKAFDILLLLLEERGRLVGKDELIRRIWPDAVVEENNLTVNVSALRKALGESRGERRYVVTVPGRGYQFVAEVRADASESAAGLEEPPAAAERPPEVGVAARPRGRRPFVVLLGALLAAAVALPYLATLRSAFRHREASGRSIAVLPFTNVGNDPRLEYLSDGISESLINSLSQLPGVTVIARSSAFRYRDAKVDPRDVAAALRVESIVTGRVIRRGEVLSISVELVDALRGTETWGEQYSRKAADLLGVQSEISAAIAEQLRLRLDGRERGRLDRSAKVDPRAYELMLEGRFHFNKGSDDERKKALDYYRQAIAVDPSYAPAQAELANAYGLLGHDGVIDQKEAFRQAEAAAERALALDEGLPEAHRALAFTRQLAWDWKGAEREYRRAIELNPSYADARASYSSFLSLMRRDDEAVAEARRAKELDPMSIPTSAWIFVTLFCARRYDEAMDVVARMRELDPSHPLTLLNLGYVDLATGRYREAIEVFEQALGRRPDDWSAPVFLGCAYAKAGQRAKAEAALEGLERTKDYVPPAELADLYASLGQGDRAFASLEKAYAAHDLQLQYLGVDPMLDPLRSDPRFADLMRRVGLAR